eukprot:CAMPEP_0175178680 /NCGR_PEP_ID=MMETSP0087-20121206/35103_1 /TAXON_ID=136419 /ORGANISM="Unknown Unknown, Strain D1" /LENGTH=238 /DNA_ID=CAMNT_0016470849 /DNA_START=844 /DNA_END=1557 /DNA_ORIENTATION=+
MIFAGEFVLQLSIAHHSDSKEAWYKTSLGLCVGLVICFVIQYSHGQPHHPEDHVIKNSSSFRAVVWVRLHQGMALAVLCIAVGVSKIFDYGLLTFDPSTPEGERSLRYTCLGCFFVQGMVTCMRILIKGCPGQNGQKCRSPRTLAYGFRFLTSGLYLLVYLVFWKRAIASALALFVVCFLIAFVTTSFDVFRQKELEHAHHSAITVEAESNCDDLRRRLINSGTSDSTVDHSIDQFVE